MNSLIVFSTLVLFFYCNNLGIVAVPTFEIRSGNCSNVTSRNLAYQKNVHLGRVPFMRREDNAYIKSFSAALRFEYSGTGITIQHLSPMFVNTKMNNFSDKLRVNSFLVPDAHQYARYAICTLGRTDVSSGYWTHGIQTFFTKLPPVWLRMYIGAQLNQSFRKDYLEQKKAENNNYENKIIETSYAKYE